MQDHSYQGAWSWSSGSGSQQEKNREMVWKSRAVLRNQSLSTASSPWMSGRATVLRPADSLSVNRSPPSSSVTLTQTSWPSISPLQLLLWQKPWKDVGSVQFIPWPNTLLPGQGSFLPKWQLPNSLPCLSNRHAPKELTLTKAFFLEFSAKHFLIYNCSIFSQHSWEVGRNMLISSLHATHAEFTWLPKDTSQIGIAVLD